MIRSIAITILIALFTLIIILSIVAFISTPAHGQGCLPDAVIYAANDAGYAILYHQRGQMDKINQSINLTYAYDAPDHYTRRLLIAKRYWKMGYKRLAARHLIYASQHPCW